MNDPSTTDIAAQAASATSRELWVVSRVFPPDDGGVQTYARSVALAYLRMGWTVRVFTKTSIGPRRVIEDGLHIVDVGHASKNVVYLRLARELRKALKQARREGREPVHLHACTWRSGIVPMLLRIAPMTVTVHGREIGRPQGLGAGLMRRVLHASTRIVGVSNWTLDHLLQRMPELRPRSVVAWNGLSGFSATTVSGARNHHDPLVLSACRLVPRKNLRLAVAAAADCMKRGLRFRYYLAGRGPEMAALQADVDALGLGDRIRLLGYVSDEELAQLYADASVFMHPQIELEDGAEMEGFGIAIADAMAFGLPCIAGVAGGPSELVDHGHTGLLVDGRDCGAIADALHELLQDPERADRMGMAARRWTQEHLSWEQHGRLAIPLAPPL